MNNTREMKIEWIRMGMGRWVGVHVSRHYFSARWIEFDEYLEKKSVFAQRATGRERESEGNSWMYTLRYDGKTKMRNNFSICYMNRV